MKQIIIALFCALFTLNAVAEEALTIAINEGDSYQTTIKDMRDKYQDLSVLLSKSLKREVVIIPVDNNDKLRKGLEAQKYDLALVHPAHVSLASLDTGKYQLVALTKGFTNYRARFLVTKNSSIKSLADIKDKRIITLDADSITAVIARATLRDAGIQIDGFSMKAVKYQDSVPFFVENGFADVGIVGSAAIAKDWQAKGGRVLFESKPVSVKHVIASSKMQLDEVEKVRAVLLGLESTEQGQKVLTQIGQKGFTMGGEKLLSGYGKWLVGV